MPPKNDRPSKHERSDSGEREAPTTADAMMNELQTDLCELGMMELVDYVHEFLPETAANMIAIKQLNRMWRFIAMMAAHWEGATFCKCGKHMLLNPTKLQKPNAEKDAWCCESYGCEVFCTCNIPKCLKDDDELQDQRIGGYPAFEFLGIDFGVCHESELGHGFELVEALQKHQPNIDNVYFDSWPQHDVVAIRFLAGSSPSNGDINNKLLERFGPRNLRLFCALEAPVSPTALAKCRNLKWLDLFAATVADTNAMQTTIGLLTNLKRLHWPMGETQEQRLKLLRESTAIECLALDWAANDAMVEDAVCMKNLRRLDLAFCRTLLSEAGIKNLVSKATRLEKISLRASWLKPACIATVSNMTTLRELDCTFCELGDTFASQLAVNMPRLEVLMFSARPITDTGMVALGRLALLWHLELRDVPQGVTSGALNAAFANLRQLRALRLSNCQAKGNSDLFQFLEKLGKLEVLSLDYGGTDEALFHAKGLTKLRKLDLKCCSVTSEGVAHIAHLAQLELLALGGTKIDDNALQHISAGLHKLRWLCLWHCEKITDKCLQYIAAMKQLEFLDISWCDKIKKTAEIVTAAEGMNKLRYLINTPPRTREPKSTKELRSRLVHIVVV